MILLAIVFSICACRHSNESIYISPDDGRVQYRLLHMNDQLNITLVGSGSEEEEEEEVMD